MSGAIFQRVILMILQGLDDGEDDLTRGDTHIIVVYMDDLLLGATSAEYTPRSRSTPYSYIITVCMTDS